jgi:hypothetical protein
LYVQARVCIPEHLAAPGLRLVEQPQMGVVVSDGVGAMQWIDMERPGERSGRRRFGCLACGYRLPGRLSRQAKRAPAR